MIITKARILFLLFALLARSISIEAHKLKTRKLSNRKLRKNAKKNKSSSSSDEEALTPSLPVVTGNVASTTMEIPDEEPTEAPVEPTEAPVEPTEEPVEPTEAPVEPTEAPAEPTEAPVDPTEAPVDPTEAPVEPDYGWSDYGWWNHPDGCYCYGDTIYCYIRPEAENTDFKCENGVMYDMETGLEYIFPTPSPTTTMSPTYSPMTFSPTTTMFPSTYSSSSTSSFSSESSSEVSTFPGPPKGCKTFTVEVKTDRFPQDTAWQIIRFGKKSGEAIIVEESPRYKKRRTVHATEVCLPANANFVFRFVDSWGDGICCDIGEGYYRVTDTCGEVVVDSGEIEGDFDEKLHLIDPSTCDSPTIYPTDTTTSPESSPEPTRSPTRNPTSSPTKNPTRSPTKAPTGEPTLNPTRNPTKSLTSTCEDVTTSFEVKNKEKSQDCNWVLKNAETRCNRKVITPKGNTKRASHYCPKTCGECE